MQCTCFGFALVHLNQKGQCGFLPRGDTSCCHELTCEGCHDHVQQQYLLCCAVHWLAISRTEGPGARSHLSCPQAGFGARHGSAIALAVPLVLVCMPNGIALSLVMVQRASMMGVMPAPFARVGCDALLGAVMGATVLATLGLQAPWIAGACGRRLQVQICAREGIGWC